MEMSQEEIEKTLADFGIVYNKKNNMSQLGGFKVLLEILKRGQYFERLSELFGPYKARTILQSVLGLWAGGT